MFYNFLNAPLSITPDYLLAVIKYNQLPNRSVIMKPTGMLIDEHHLVGRMINIIRLEISKIENSGKIIDASVLDSIVDFLRFYINITHHEKEDILLNKLKEKPIRPEDIEIIEQLIEEHKYMKTAIDDIVNAEMQYFKGENTLGIIITTFNALISLYPKHIQKEEENIFPIVEKYFNDDELALMQNEFDRVDREMIHKKYKTLIEELKK
ncbi:MAG TPA: cation-binding protein [Phycisphaerales bacterium]|nr:cation-binding protein [Phycisphaerales bacterium]